MNAEFHAMPTLALLAGGLATRLLPLTEQIPKSLISIADQPFIAHQLRYVRAQGIQRVVICAGHLWQPIREFVGDGAQFDLSVDYSLEDSGLLGTGGAIKKALPKLGEDFFVMYGDSYLPTQFRPVMDYFRHSGSLALMTVHQNEGKWDRSNVVFRDGNISVYDKKYIIPEMEHIDYGLGCFKRAAFDGYKEGVRVDLADVYRDLLSSGQLAGYEIKERFYEIGSREGIRETDRLLRQRGD